MSCEVSPGKINFTSQKNFAQFSDLLADNPIMWSFFKDQEFRWKGLWDHKMFQFNIFCKVKEIFFPKNIEDGKTWGNPDVYMENTWVAKIHTQLLAKDKIRYTKAFKMCTFIDMASHKLDINSSQKKLTQIMRYMWWVDVLLIYMDKKENPGNRGCQRQCQKKSNKR